MHRGGVESGVGTVGSEYNRRWNRKLELLIQRNMTAGSRIKISTGTQFWDLAIASTCDDGRLVVGVESQDPICKLQQPRV